VEPGRRGGPDLDRSDLDLLRGDQLIKIHCNGNIHMSHRRIMPLQRNGKVLIKCEFCRVYWRQRSTTSERETIMSKITRADLAEEVAVLKASNVVLLSFADGAAVMARTEGKPNVREWEQESAVLLHESIDRAEQTIRQLENLIKKMDELGIDSFGDE
jgi:hypothetical protein